MDFIISLACRILGTLALLGWLSMPVGLIAADDATIEPWKSPGSRLAAATEISGDCCSIATPMPSGQMAGLEEVERIPTFQEAEQSIPLKAVFGDGFSLKSTDDQFQLRIRTLTQVDGKAFSPTDQEPARSGIYIPRFRIYFEGQLTDVFEYELSLQRSVEGTFDVLDANVNFVQSEQFQVRAGRALVPYSYAWYDHLEQYYITPERGLFALNFGLARQAGVFAHGKLREDRVQYAVGATFGQLSGLADTNTTRDGVGYLNIKPFLHTTRHSWLRALNVGFDAPRSALNGRVREKRRFATQQFAMDRLRPSRPR